MRKTPLVLAAALTVVTAGCYRDFDFTADSKADYAVTRADGSWFNKTTNAAMHSGTPDDWPVPADWNGDHFWDMAVVHPNGDWVTNTTLGTISFPAPPELAEYDAHWSLTVLPVPADYDGDGSVEPAWYRESDGAWFFEGEVDPVMFGSGPSALPGTGSAITENDYDYPVPADYDGDHKDDLAVFNPWTGSWRVKASSTGTVSDVTIAGGQRMAMPVPGDYDGLGHAQRAVYSPDGWFIEGHGAPDLFGSEGAGEAGFPAVADFNGDGLDDLSYVGWSSNTWFTKGVATTVTVDLGNQEWPLPSGNNLEWNVGRLSVLGSCSADPDSCPAPVP